MEDRVRERVEPIVAHLDDWVIANGDGPRDRAVYLVGPENTRVLVSQPWNQNNRIEFSISLDAGLYNFEPYNKDNRPQATVSASREPMAAAKDVKRRCLDPAIPYVRELREKKAESDAVNNARLRLLEALASACGGKVFGQYGQPAEKPMESSARRGEHGNPSVKASLTYGKRVDQDTDGPDRVKMEIDYLSQRDATDLLRWLRFRLWPENGQQGRLL